MKKLSELLVRQLEPLAAQLSAAQLQAQWVSGVASDTRELLQPGMIWVVIQGSHHDAYADLARAYQQAPCLIVVEDLKRAQSVLPAGAALLQVADARRCLSLLAAAFYEFPAEEMLILGVTGTSGKTSVSYLVAAILQAAGHTVGLIGTVEIRVGEKKRPSQMTTPSGLELAALFREMRQAAGCTAVVMEVSSHALDQSRVAGVPFDGMIFTNFSHEHLDYHQTMERYFQAKALLFTEQAYFSRLAGKKPVALLPVSAEGRKMQQCINNFAQFPKQPESQAHDWPEQLGSLGSARERLSGSSQPQASPEVIFYQPPSALALSEAGIVGDFGGVAVVSKLVGEFNAWNIAAASHLAQALGVSDSVIAGALSAFERIPGRLEKVTLEQEEGGAEIDVWVDYAHKPEALKSVLTALGAFKKQGARLITVFGCGGERDRAKRPLMGQIAAQYSDWLVVTSDNPRSEDPQQIITEILQGVAQAGAGETQVQVESDREKAIYQALALARPGDQVLIAGKGHERLQWGSGGEAKAFDDREVAARALLWRRTQIS